MKLSRISRQSFAATLSLILILLSVPGATLAQSHKKSRRSAKHTAKPADQTAAADSATGDAAKADTAKSSAAETAAQANAGPSAPPASPNDQAAPPVTETSAALDSKNGAPAASASQTPAQNPPATQTTTPDQTTPDKIVRTNQQPPEDRVGIDLKNVLNMSIHDAVVLALNKNLDIAVNRVNVEEAEYDLKGSKGVFDPVFTSNVNYFSQTTPTASIFAGAVAGSFTQRGLNYNPQLTQNLPEYGGNYVISMTNSRTTTTSTANILNPQYSNNLNIRFDQPLLRNFKIDANRRNIMIFKRQLDLSDIAFKQQAITTINQVEDAYWNLVFAIRNEDIARDALDLAVNQLEQNKKQLAAGALAPLDVIQSQTQVESSKVTVFAALQQVTTAENQLKTLMSDDPNNTPFWSARIIPTTPVDTQPLALNLDDAVKIALNNRPELQTIRDRIAMNEIDVAFFRNQTKPQVDFIGSYGINGLAGAPVLQTQDKSASINSFINSINQLNQMSPGHIPGFVPFDLLPSNTIVVNNVNPDFSGGQFTALGNLFGNKFRTYQFGVSISYPIHNRLAEANLGHTLAAARQLDLLAKQQVQGIQVEVRNALQAVQSARQRIEAATAASYNAQKQLEGEQEKFKAGLSTLFVVLQRQNDLSAARGQLLSAQTDYNKAIADLQRVLATTLEAAGVTVQSPVTMDGGQQILQQQRNKTANPRP